MAPAGTVVAVSPWAALTLAVTVVGCTHAGTAPPPQGDPWAERSDDQTHADVSAALQRAREHHKRVLLEFIAPWCPDCRTMTRIETLPPASDVLRDAYERVRVNVGPSFNQHRDLLGQYGIDRIAAYVVLDPATGQRVAQTTMEPVSRHLPMTSALWAEWLRNPRMP